MTPELALQLGRAVTLRRRPRQDAHAAHRHRQGHAPLGLHARDRASRRASARWADGSCSCGPLPTPAIAHLTVSMRADAGDRHQREPQPVRGQRHQDLRRRRLQAPRRGRGRDRAAHARTDALSDACPTGPASAGPSGSRTRAGATSSFAKTTFPRELSLDGVRIVVDAAHGAAYRVAPLVFTELGARGHRASASSPTA